MQGEYPVTIYRFDIEKKPPLSFEQYKEQNNPQPSDNALQRHEEALALQIAYGQYLQDTSSYSYQFSPTPPSCPAKPIRKKEQDDYIGCEIIGCERTL